MRRVLLCLLLMAPVPLVEQLIDAQGVQAPSPEQRNTPKRKRQPVKDGVKPSPSTTPEPSRYDPSHMNSVTAIRTAAGVIFVFGLLLYPLPSYIAFGRKHHNKGAILALNLLLGWTAVGWIAAFIWAFTNPPPAAQVRGAGT